MVEDMTMMLGGTCTVGECSTSSDFSEADSTSLPREVVHAFKRGRRLFLKGP